MALIELRGIYKNYRMGSADVPALRGIDLTIERGELVALWGPSGSGKSSLLNLIGLIDSPTEGEIIIDGAQVRNMSDDILASLRNRMIGFVFQSFNLVPVLSALENVMLPLQIRGVSPSLAKSAALKKLESVGIKDLAGSRPDQMSGGQRQRVSIARALVTEPSIVLADEPTANLDSETSMQIVTLMQDLNAKDGVVFLFATHDPRLLDKVSRQIRIEDGKIDYRSVNDVHLANQSTQHL